MIEQISTCGECPLLSRDGNGAHYCEHPKPADFETKQAPHGIVHPRCALRKTSLVLVLRAGS